MFGIALDRASRRSLALQLADGLRKAVVSGELGPGARLPPSRELAMELGISRRLVTDAYEQLTGEGYFETRAGHGTYAAALPVRSARWRAQGQADEPAPERAGGLGGPSLIRPPQHDHPQGQADEPAPVRQRAPEAERGFAAGSDLERAGGPGGPSSTRRPRQNVQFDFTPGIPDLAAFPRQAWRRAADESISLARPADLSYGPALGDARLRHAIAGYLYRFRGLTAEPGTICITSGTSHSLSLLSRLLPPSALFCEDPGLGFARDTFAAAGFHARPVHVDEGGALPTGLGEVPRGALFYLTPSHQFPTGALLPLRRRVELLELAAGAEGLVLEDDYDSEFRFRGSPVPPLASLDAERVVYLGTFSKCLAPFVRVGYLVAPSQLVGPLADLVRRTNLRGSVPHQRTLARFIEEGHLEKHVFSMKRRYRARLEVILSFLEERWGSEVRAGGAETGFHLHLRFRSRRFGRPFLDACNAEGLRISTEADFLADPPPESDALVIGYGNIADARLDQGLAALAALVEKHGAGV